VSSDGGRLVMLDKFNSSATIAATDLERAKGWYADKLGMKPAREDEAGAYYETGSTEFLLFPTPFAGTAQNTVMGWTVDDVASEVSELKARGVSFETFEAEGVTWDGEIATMGETKGAWFKDSEGNTLAISD
jgi:catechol 2,3-dioxygenase-like lactoylglutathione lyase family enzyme